MRPNILFILIDDLGCRDLGCFGSTFYETPNLDRLAASGMRFTNAYASCCVCSPTRASILSGKYPARLGVTNWIGGMDEGKLATVPYLHYLPLEETSLATTLRENGYQTWHVGKWHLGDEAFYPQHHGFSVNIGGGHRGCPHKGYFSPYDLENLVDGPEGEYLTDRLTEEALRLIRRRDDKPFFLHLSHYAVHTPIQAPLPLVEKYRAKACAMRLDQSPALIEGENFPCLHKRNYRLQRRIFQSDPAYAALLENLDTNIGRVLSALDEEGILENTLVFFTSDNGGLSTAEGSPTCNFPAREGKGWGYEGGTRVCQLASWQGVIKPGTVCSENVISTDFYPTILEAAGLPLMPQQHCDGVSLLGLLKGCPSVERDAIYWHYPHYGNQGGTPHTAVVSGRWKLIEWFETGRAELFDLVTDPSEVIDCHQQKPQIVSQLLEKLRRWREEVEAQIPQPNPKYVSQCKRPQIPNNAAE